jgi:hypothetical protein
VLYTECKDLSGTLLKYFQENLPNSAKMISLTKLQCSNSGLKVLMIKVSSFEGLENGFKLDMLNKKQD